MASLRTRNLFLLENSALKFDSSGVERRSKHSIFKSRFQLGEFHLPYNELRKDSTEFFEYCRMSPSAFDYIVQAIRQHISHISTNFQNSFLKLSLKPFHLAFDAPSASTVNIAFTLLVNVPIANTFQHEFLSDNFDANKQICHSVYNQRQPVQYGLLYRHYICHLQHKKYFKKLRKISIFAGIFQTVLEA
jgi:hypothetical protein